MRPFVLALLLTMPMAALAQQGPYADQTSCGQFVAFDNGVQLQLLSQIEPFGDDIEAGDRDAGEEWVKAVSKVCAGQPDMNLAEAARKAELEE